MLGFFRKYQKFFFAFVAFFIIVSFSFFGTYGTFTNNHEAPDREIGQLVDGSKLMEQRLYGLLQVLQHGIEEGSRNPNLLNDSIVHKEFLLSGLGEILAEHIFEDMEKELQDRWVRIKNYVPYEHPFAPHISAKNVWMQFSPKIVGILDEIREAPAEFSKENLPLLFRCYAAQAEFPAPMLHQILYYRQKQSEVRPDPGLPGANVSLFGFQSVEDWFGPKFVEEMGKFILNAACIAKQEGYRVSYEEAQVNLFSNVVGGMKLFGEGQMPDMDEAQQVYTMQIRSRGLEEKEAVEHWRDVMHFQRFFKEVGEAVFVDSLAFDHFKQFSKPANQICRYYLPSFLQFSNVNEMLKFQRYLEIVADGDVIGLPTHFRDPQEIMDVHLNLVYKNFEVEVASVTKKEVAAKISLKETWDWESQAENFSKIQEHFSLLQGVHAETLEDRMEALDALKNHERFAIDQFARNQLFETHPEWIDDALMMSEREKRTLKVRLEEKDNPFSGAHFLALLEGEDQELAHFSPDGEHFFAISVLNKGSGWNLLSYEECENLMEEKLDQLLLEAYAAQEFVEPFEEVRDQVARTLYSDLFAAIGTSVEEAPKHRFDAHLQAMRALAIADPDAFALAQEGPFGLMSQSEQISLEKDTMEVGQYSPIERGGFYQLLEKAEAVASAEEVAVAKEHLKREAQGKLMRKLIEKM